MSTALIVTAHLSPRGLDMQAEYDLLQLALNKLKAPPLHTHEVNSLGNLQQPTSPEAGGREKALAITNLEQAIMWLIKAAKSQGVQVNDYND